MPSRFLSDLGAFLRTDAERRSGGDGAALADEDRLNEGRLIGGLLPTSIGPPAALGAGLAYEWGVKPYAKWLQETGVPSGSIPEILRHEPGVSSEPGFLSGLRRALRLARGATERTIPGL